MTSEQILYGYIFGTLIFTVVLTEDISMKDIFCSFVAALFWPVTFPAGLIKRLLR